MPPAMRRITVYSILLLLTTASAASAQTDTVTTATGEKIVGEIIKVEKDVLTMSTPYSDSDFKIKWGQVVAIDSARQFRIETFDGTGSPNCASGHDTEIRLFASNGTTQLAVDDDSGFGACSLVDPALVPAAQHLVPGTYYVRVEEHLKDSVIADYILNVTFPALLHRRRDCLNRSDSEG